MLTTYTIGIFTTGPSDGFTTSAVMRCFHSPYIPSDLLANIIHRRVRTLTSPDVRLTFVMVSWACFRGTGNRIYVRKASNCSRNILFLFSESPFFFGNISESLLTFLFVNIQSRCILSIPLPHCPQSPPFVLLSNFYMYHDVYEASTKNVLLGLFVLVSDGGDRPMAMDSVHEVRKAPRDMFEVWSTFYSWTKSSSLSSGCFRRHEHFIA